MRARAKPTQAEEPFLSLDTRLDILGGTLIVFALVTILAIISPQSGAFTRALLRLLTVVFGWGGFVIPFALGGVGVWLIWRHFGSQLPPVDPVRISGGALLFLGTLTLAHALTASTQPLGPVYINPTYPTISEALAHAVACPSTPQVSTMPPACAATEKICPLVRLGAMCVHVAPRS